MSKRERDLIEDAFLYAYPNPERTGCAPENERPALLRALARKELPIGHPYGEHLGRCSPCFQEFVPFRDAYKAERERVRFFQAAAAVILVVASSVAGYVLTRKPSESPAAPIARRVVPPRLAETWTTIALNYEDASAPRGFERRQAVIEQHAPRKPDALRIYLPLGSDDGRYQIQVRKGSKDGSSLQTWSGAASVQDGDTILEVNADLSAFAPGHYMLAYRHADASWRLVPLMID